MLCLDIGAEVPLLDGAFEKDMAPPCLAGFRSLARVLADTLLAGAVDRSQALCRDFGPGAGTETAERRAPLNCF